MKQEGLFDLPEGIRRRDLAMDYVDRDAEWADRAKAWVIALADATRFTTDDVAAACGYPDCDPRAFGSLIRWLARRKYIAHTNLPPMKSARAQCHARPITNWKRTR